MTHPNPDKQYVIDGVRRYILSSGRKFTGRRYGTARVLIHYRDLLQTYVTAKREITHREPSSD